MFLVVLSNLRQTALDFQLKRYQEILNVQSDAKVSMLQEDEMTSLVVRSLRCTIKIIFAFFHPNDFKCSIVLNINLIFSPDLAVSSILVAGRATFMLIHSSRRIQSYTRSNKYLPNISISSVILS